ncbi:MAG: zf-HC2 domain-containing protein [Nitriliruptorales bacterium]|nr:zf-HC2 domain-containing protein [Nitriliruptorales bacterium]
MAAEPVRPDGAEEIRQSLVISCADAIELMTDWLDELLVDGDRERLAAHLAGCQACGVYLDQLRATVTIVGSLRGHEAWQVDDATMAMLVDRFRQSQV